MLFATTNFYFTSVAFSQPIGFDNCVQSGSAPFVKAEYKAYRDAFKCDISAYTEAERDSLPIATVRVNFHYRQNSDPNAPQFYYGGPNDYSYLNVETYSSLILSEMNSIFSNLVDNPISSPDVIGDSRIRFVLYTDPHNSLDLYNGIWIHSGAPDWNATGYGFDVLNIYLDGQATDAGGGFVCCRDFSSNLITLKHNSFQAPTSTWWYKGRLAGHEFLHMATLCHSFAPEQCDGVDLNAVNECNNNGKTGYCGQKGPCDPWNSGSTNIMGYNNNQSSLSPCQWSKAYTYIHQYQPDYITFCEDKPGDLVIYTGQNITWDRVKFVYQNVVVQPGATLTIKCDVRMATDKMIYVERSGRLNIDGAYITNMCKFDAWTGIVMEGNGSFAQPSLNDVLLPDKAAIVHTYNLAIIEGAGTAISTTASRRTWPNNDYWGGKIVSEYTIFKNNHRAIEFMKYTLGETSTFDHCEFYEDDNQPSLSHGITIWACNGLTITESRFHNMDEFGIYGIDYSLKVHSNSSFTYLGTNAIESSESAPFQSYAEIGNTNTGQNTFNQISNACVYSTSQTGSEGLKVANNSMSNCNTGVDINNLAYYEVFSNAFDHMNIGTRVFKTQSANNFIRCNSFFNDMQAGINIVGKNGSSGNGVSYLYNQFYSPAYDIAYTKYSNEYASGKEIIGSSLLPANNCFSPVPINISAPISQALHFSYFYSLQYPCYNPHGSLSDGGSNNYHEFVTGNGPVNVMCGTSGPAFSEDIAQRSEDNSSMEHNENDIYSRVLDLYHRNDIAGIEQLLRTSATMTDQWLLYGVYFKKGMYSEAANWISSRTPINEDDAAFSDIQKVNLSFMSKGLNGVTISDSLRLEQYAADETLLSSAYAIGLLKILYSRIFAPKMNHIDIERQNAESYFAEGSQFGIAPNPTNGVVKIYNLNGNNATYRLISNSGLELFNGLIGSTEEIKGVDISTLPSGIYFFQLIQANTTETTKLIKL